MIQPIRFADLPRSPWPNGAGRKADIAVGPMGEDGRPDWLLAFAWLDAEASFSDYSGFDRTITLVSGVAFVLDFGQQAPSLVVDAPFRPTAFDGGLPARCLLPAGPCLVLNVMTRRGCFAHSVAVVSTRAPLPPAAGERYAVVLRGRCAIEGRLLDPRDAVPLCGGGRVAAAAEALLAVVAILPGPG